MVDVIHSRAWRELRAALKAEWAPQNPACALCGQATIDWDGPANAADSFEPDHIWSRKTHPELALVRSNLRPSHGRCNRSRQAGAVRPGIGETSEAW